MAEQRAALKEKVNAAVRAACGKGCEYPDPYWCSRERGCDQRAREIRAAVKAVLPPSAAPSLARPRGTECEHGRHLCPQCDAEHIKAASPVSPDAEAMELARQLYNASRYAVGRLDAKTAISNIAAALTAATTREREAATIRAIEFVEGGRFLHDGALPKRFAMECAAEMRKQLLKPIRDRSGKNQTE